MAEERERIKYCNADLSTIRVEQYIGIEGFIIFLDLYCDFTDWLEGAHLQGQHDEEGRRREGEVWRRGGEGR